MVLEIPVGSRNSQTRNANYAQVDSLFVRHFNFHPLRKHPGNHGWYDYPTENWAPIFKELS